MTGETVLESRIDVIAPSLHPTGLGLVVFDHHVSKVVLVIVQNDVVARKERPSVEFAVVDTRSFDGITFWVTVAFQCGAAEVVERCSIIFRVWIGSRLELTVSPELEV